MARPLTPEEQARQEQQRLEELSRKYRGENLDAQIIEKLENFGKLRDGVNGRLLDGAGNPVRVINLEGALGRMADSGIAIAWRIAKHIHSYETPEERQKIQKYINDTLTEFAQSQGITGLPEINFNPELNSDGTPKNNLDYVFTKLNEKMNAKMVQLSADAAQVANDAAAEGVDITDDREFTGWNAGQGGGPDGFAKRDILCTTFRGTETQIETCVNVLREKLGSLRLGRLSDDNANAFRALIRKYGDSGVTSLIGGCIDASDGRTSSVAIHQLAGSSVNKGQNDALRGISAFLEAVAPGQNLGINNLSINTADGPITFRDGIDAYRDTKTLNYLRLPGSEKILKFLNLEELKKAISRQAAEEFDFEHLKRAKEELVRREEAAATRDPDFEKLRRNQQAENSLIARASNKVPLRAFVGIYQIAKQIVGRINSSSQSSPGAIGWIKATLKGAGFDGKKDFSTEAARQKIYCEELKKQCRDEYAFNRIFDALTDEGEGLAPGLNVHADEMVKALNIIGDGSDLAKVNDGSALLNAAKTARNEQLNFVPHSDIYRDIYNKGDKLGAISQALNASMAAVADGRITEDAVKQNIARMYASIGLNPAKAQEETEKLFAAAINHKEADERCRVAAAAVTRADPATADPATVAAAKAAAAAAEQQLIASRQEMQKLVNDLSKTGISKDNKRISAVETTAGLSIEPEIKTREGAESRQFEAIQYEIKTAIRCVHMQAKEQMIEIDDVRESLRYATPEQQEELVRQENEKLARLENFKQGADKLESLLADINRYATVDDIRRSLNAIYAEGVELLDTPRTQIFYMKETISRHRREPRVLVAAFGAKYSSQPQAVKDNLVAALNDLGNGQSFFGRGYIDPNMDPEVFIKHMDESGGKALARINQIPPLTNTR